MTKESENFVSLSEIFQDGMTLQRNKPINLLGTAKDRQHISVLLNNVLLYEGELSAGNFRFALPPQEAMENVTLLIKNQEGEAITLHNVDIGEVWIAGGQSNMEFPLFCEKNGEQVIAAANDEHLRYYEVGKYAFDGEREENLKNGRRWNNWRRFVPEECTHFSAVATYYARILREKLGVPVAIVGCCWGGTSASAWMDEALLRQDEKLRVYTDAYDQATAKINLKKYLKADRKNRAFMGSEKNTIGAEMTMKKEVTAPLKFPLKQLVKIMILNQKTGPHSENRPGGLYQTMLSKITGFTARGVIWYQGETDEHQSALYGRLFSKLISCWRRDWQDELPFLFVQLAPWGEWMAQDGRNYPMLRAQQQYVEDHVKGTYMASIMDVGSQYDIHPKVKEPVGNRLALLSLDQIYGVKQKYSHAPRISEMKRVGKDIIVSFDYAEGGLTADGSIDSLFSVTQRGQDIPFTCKITENRVVLSCRNLTDEKVTVAFAYQPYLVMNLFNQGGLPARPSEPQGV